MSDRSTRVAITGMAAATCRGIGSNSFLQRLAQGIWPKSGFVAPVGQNGARHLPQITHDISALTRKTRTDYLLTCHLMATVDLDLGLRLTGLDKEQRAQIGVVIADSSGNFKPYFDYYRKATRQGFAYVNPVHFPVTLMNYSSVQLNSAFSLKGSSTTISSGIAGGLDAIGYAAMRLLRGKEGLTIAGGIEALNDVNMGLLLHQDACSPKASIHPMRQSRDGTVPGEGIGALLLEPLPAARAQGKQILGEVLGYGSAKGLDQESETDRQKKAVGAIQQALQTADVTIDDIDAIFPSANGTVTGDDFEADVLDQVFGSRATSIPLYPIKSIIGECFTASGPLQCIAALYALNAEQASPDDFGEGSERGIGDLLLPDKIRPCQRALVYTFGLDNTYAALVLTNSTRN